MIGGAGDDTLYGGHGCDTLDSGEGTDCLVGGTCDDVMSGGADAVSDTFVFLRFADGSVAPEGGPEPGDETVYNEVGTGDGFDVILDFDAANDKLVFQSNEEMSVIRTFDGSNTVLTYVGDETNPESQVMLGVGETAALDIQVEVNADFEFIL